MRNRKFNTLKAVSVLVPAMALYNGCAENKSNLLADPVKNKDGKYNIIFLTTDQENYMRTYPQGSNYQARERLRKIGTSFEKHYACSNVSTSSRSVIYTGRHVTETLMLDNTNITCQPNMSKDLKTVGDMMREAGYLLHIKGNGIFLKAILLWKSTVLQTGQKEICMVLHLKDSTTMQLLQKTP